MQAIPPYLICPRCGTDDCTEFPCLDMKGFETSNDEFMRSFSYHIETVILSENVVFGRMAQMAQKAQESYTSKPPDAVYNSVSKRKGKSKSKRKRPDTTASMKREFYEMKKRIGEDFPAERFCAMLKASKHSPEITAGIAAGKNRNAAAKTYQRNRLRSAWDAAHAWIKQHP